MYERSIFVFGSKIFHEDETKRDSITCLPLEMAWKIFMYLDNISLRNAKRSNKTWSNIILANKQLRIRLNQFELAIEMGSERLARFHRNNKRKLKRRGVKSYLTRGEEKVKSRIFSLAAVKIPSTNDVTVHVKRFKLF